LVLVVLYSGLRLGLNGWDSGERRAEASNRLRSVQEFLRRQLAQSMTVYETNDDRRERFVVFAGRAGRDRICGADAGAPGSRRVIPDVDRNGGWSVATTPAAIFTDDPAAGEERVNVLLEGVSAMEWAYFGPERDNDQESPRWHADWTSTERRPLLVRLNLTLRGESWPDLVVALVEGPR
jgi:general secretion pathway protein J